MRISRIPTDPEFTEIRTNITNNVTKKNASLITIVYRSQNRLLAQFKTSSLLFSSLLADTRLSYLTALIN